MRFPRFVLPIVGLVAAVTPLAAAPSASAWVTGDQIALSQWLSPDASLSTSGDYATDTFSDPWDFNNVEDMLPIEGVGVAVATSPRIEQGIFKASVQPGAELRLLMKWPHFIEPVLPWGRDGWAHPIDGARYTQTTFRIQSDQNLPMAVRYWRADGQGGQVNFSLPAGGWQTIHLNMLAPEPGSAPWAGPIVRFELFSAGAGSLQLDWVRLHRADAPQAPPANVPIPQVLTPNEQGGADYATVERRNPWDFAGMDDVGEVHDVANLTTASGDLQGTSVANDPFIGLPLGPELNTDRYHRLTLDVCMDGGFNLTGSPGGGMVGRMAWIKDWTGVWSETQDFVVFPGCHTMTIDLATTPASAVHDTFTAYPVGWRGIRVTNLRFDLNEDPGRRNFTLRNVKLADDAAFSTSYPITWYDVAGTAGAKADIYVTTQNGAYNGTRIASNISVAGGTNTFNWTGTDERGAPMPNGTYYVYVVQRTTAGVGVGYASGPLRLEKPVPPTPSYYVPLNPARLLDTRTGEGGNISPLGNGVFTELDVTGVGGVPETGVTAVVMNVTVTGPTASGFITAWPSGEPKPFVSNLNFVPGQEVPNLVTVKIGANGRVNLFNSAGDSNVIADVVGYYTPNAPPSGGRFTAVTPARLLDTRDGTGGFVGALSQLQSIDLKVTGVGGVPASGVTGVALNVTVDQPTGTGYLTVWPTGEPRPNASTHNFVPGLTVANMVLAKVGAGGKVSIYNSAGNTHVVADVIGYFSSSGGAFVPVTPQRLVDTREGIGGAGTMGNADTHTMQVANANPVPAGAKAVIVNVTSVNSSAPSFITVWPTAAQQPLASTLNPRPGFAVPNQAYLRVGNGGALDAFNAHGSTDLVVDVFGYVM